METPADQKDMLPPEVERRLHPMTLIQRVIVSLPGLFLLLLPLLRAPDRQAWLSLFFLIFYGAVALPLIFLQYFRFRYRITPKEIVIRSGVFTRRDRSIPIERIQNIEIEQSLLPRLFGTAKVKIETAGSTSTEGVLDLVSLGEAHNIRRIVRAYQRQQKGAAAAQAETAPLPAPEASEAAPTAPARDVERHGDLLFTMPLSRVLLSGMFRFSLLYIVVIFSGLEYLGLDPEEIVLWFEHGGFRPVARFAAREPWLLALVSLFLAAALAWISGILINLNRYYNFELELEGDKLHKRHGLLTVTERTIPLKKIQTLILRSNLLMRHFGWWRLELQTMGPNVEQQGHQVAAPFAQLEDILRLAPHLYPFALPERFLPVSRLTIRRTAIRYTLGLLLVTLPTAFFLWRPALWALAALPLLLYLALLQYRNHGYALEDDLLYVKRGVIRPHLWVMPAERFQVFYASASLFQRRLGLKSLHVDTAGAGGGFITSTIVDLPAAEADERLQALHECFQAIFDRRKKAQLSNEVVSD